MSVVSQLDNSGAILVVDRLLIGSAFDSATNREIFIADNNYQVIGVSGKYSVGGSTTINVGKLFNASASIVGSALNLLGSSMNFFGSAALYLSGNLLNSTSLTQLVPGDSLAIIWGTANNLPPTGVLQVTLQRV
jgi:hypothetical protein